MKRYVHLANKLQEIEGMSRIGFIPSKGKTFEVYVNTDDAGKIPHFHVRDKDDWEAFHTCIKIEEPEYFLHGNKTDVLNAKERKALQEFMTDYPKKGSFFGEDGHRLNNWEYVKMLWNMNNSDVEVDDNTAQPDYTLLR